MSEEQAGLTYNDRRAKYLLSALHKFIRRAHSFEAMQAGLELATMAQHLFWSEIRTIAVGDCGQPTEITAIDVLYRQYKEMKSDDQQHKGRMWVMVACRILADATHSRTADEFLHLILREPQLVGQFTPGWNDLRYAIEDMHTYEGKASGRGYEHFVETASRCDRRSDEYDRFTREWVAIMRGSKEKIPEIGDDRD